MSKTVKRISIGFGIGLVLIVTAAIGVFIYLKTDHARHFFLSQINAAIPGSVSCLDIDFTLSDGSLELRQVSLADPDGKILAAIDSLTLALDGPALLRKELTVTSLIINKPHLNLQFDKTGRLGLLDAFPSGAPTKEKQKSEKLPFNVVINTFELIEGSVNLHKEAVSPDLQPVSVKVQGIGLTADGNLNQQRVNLELNVDAAQLNVAGLQNQIENIKIIVKNDSEEDARLRLQIDKTHIAIAGVTTQLEDIRLNVDADIEQQQADAQLSIKKAQKNIGAVKTIMRDILIDANGSLKRQHAVLKLYIDENQIDMAGNVTRINGIHLTSDADFNQQSANLKLNTNRVYLNITGEDIPLDYLKLDVAYQQERVHLKELSVAACGSQLSVTGVMQNPLTTPFFDFQVGLAAELDIIRDLLQLEMPLNGSSQLDMAIRGSLNDPEINLQLAYNGGAIAGYHIDSVYLDSNLQDLRFDIRHLNLKTGYGALNLLGQINLETFFAHGLMGSVGDPETIAYNLALDTDNFDLAQFVTADKSVQGLVNAAISVKGQGVTPAFINAETAINLDARQLTLNRDAAPIDLNVKADAQFNKQILRVDRIEADGDQFNLDAQGRWNISSGELSTKVALDAADLAKNLAPLGLKQISGGVKLDADIGGTVAHPKFKVAVAGKAVSAYNFTIGDLTLDAELGQNGLLKIARLDILNQDSSLQSAGSVQLFQDAFALSSSMPSSLEIKLSNIALNDFFSSPVFHGRIDGKINTQGNLNDLQTQVSLHGRHFGYDVYRADDLFLDGRVEGGIKKPHFPQTVLKVNALDLGVQELEEVKIVGDVDLEKVIIHTLDIVPAAGENIHAKGMIDYKGGFKIDLLSGPIDLAHIDALSNQDIVRGKAVFDIEGEGRFSDPEIKAELRFTEMFIKEKPLNDFELHLGLQDHKAQANGRLNFDIDASYHLKQKTFQAQLAFDQTDLEPYFKIANQPDLNGIITGSIQVQGKADAIDQIQGKAAFTDLRLGFKQPDMIVSHDLQINFEDNSVVIPGSTLTILDKGHLKVQGRSQIGADVDLRVEGEFPMDMINHFTDAIPDVQGNLLVLAEVEGVMAQPDISAEVNLKNIGFTIPGLMQRIRSLNGRIKAAPDSVILNNISGQMDKGRFNIDGQIDLDKFKPVRADLKLNANALPIHIPDLLDLNFNTDLHFQGTPEKSGLTGEMVILDGSYYQDIDLSLLKIAKSARQKKRQVSASRAPITQPFVKNLALDIAVKRRNPFVVDNNLAYLEINPNLNVSGTPNQPVISGRAEVESGNITFHEKEFEIKRGIIEFLNPYKIEPSIDLQAEAKIREWVVHLNIKGLPDELRFTLTSEPSEEQADLLSLILTGQTAKELSQSGGKGSTLSSEMAAAYLGKSLGDDISKMAGLDTFEVQSKGQGTEDDPETVTVTVGKELSSRMGVSVKMESKAGKTVERGEIEYKLLENFKIKGFQDSQGAFGGELLFRHEFR
ncbi:translocation/assembly module TamB domain-containing protein [Desulfococcaceae bacterium HSG7]|nr:translocation/assembly module TamB domain-containing protein [Desulfococcaceae bacterium HSG7]